MAEELKERSEMDSRFMWNLESLYKSDADWEKDLEALDDLVKVAASFEGKLSSAERIRHFLNASTDMERKLSNLFCYANLRKSEDARDPKAQDMYARIYSKYVQASTAVSFAEPEILSLPEDVLAAITEEPILDEYKRTMIKLLRQKPHTLTAAEEKLLASFGEVFGAPEEIATNLQDADLVFDHAKDAEGKEVEVSESNYILLQMSKDRALRESAFHSFYKSYQQHINTFAATYAGQVKAATASAAVRYFESSRAAAMAGEHIPVEVYDNLIKAVRKFMPSMYRYVSLRKKMLGLDELHYYDLYAPLSDGVQKKYSYEEACEEVLAAVEPLGQRYQGIVEKAFRDGWIDVYPNKGKHSGAYSSGTYDSNPYILTNFVGTLDSVSTIAHEMGHSMQTYLSNHAQPPQDADYTIFVAEVASTVNENLLIEKLLRENAEALEDAKQSGNAEAVLNVKTERMALLNQYLEGFKGTVYRQTMFAEFELQAHAAAERGEALNASKLNEIYQNLIQDYFGPELVMDDEVKLEWARIPHFYSPFYVYKYATDYSAAVALSEAILSGDAEMKEKMKKGEISTSLDATQVNPAVKRYVEFLSMGGSQDPLDELKHAGIDMSKPDSIEAALVKFGKVLDEAEALMND